MSKYIELNIKDGMPPACEAMDCLKNLFERCRVNKYKCILIIHGYGSTGKGGKIRKLTRTWLEKQKQKRKIKTIIIGEDFNIYNPKALELKNKYHELSPLLSVCNHGVTVIEI
ncbi:MAG: Smr/MutS family protein [Clostridia bacterium]|nr:Smr/MutS family protein [Clostridia bacterium]